jgi:hypothetical protein
MGRLAASSSLPPELKILLNELGSGFWQFDATRIAHMLSPDVTPPSDLVDVAYSQLKQDSSDWPRDVEDFSFHEPLLISLNDFLNASHRALDLSDPPIVGRDERWCSGLRFMGLGNENCDVHGGDHGAVKREALGGISFRETGPGAELAVGVKLDEDWPAVVAQAARSAQTLFWARQHRKFGLVIGFRHTTLELRFLIVHRGGVTASKALSVVEEGERKDILRIFLSMLMWRTEDDAGM